MEKQENNICKGNLDNLVTGHHPHNESSRSIEKDQGSREGQEHSVIAVVTLQGKAQKHNTTKKDTTHHPSRGFQQGFKPVPEVL